jgi:putative ABC transport system substrate-binding protein
MVMFMDAGIPCLGSSGLITSASARNWAKAAKTVSKSRSVLACQPTARALGMQLHVVLLRELVPQDAAIVLFVNPKNPNAELLRREVEAAARATGHDLPVMGASSEAELEAAFTALRQRQVAAIVVEADPFLDDHLEQLVALSSRHALPAIYLWRQFPEAGGLISYGPSLAGTYRQVAVYGGRILKGAKPSELPVEQPTKFELVINLKAAKALGLTIPPSLLARADEVIE